jgi:hypothetical protein
MDDVCMDGVFMDGATMDLMAVVFMDTPLAQQGRLARRSGDWKLHISMSHAVRAMVQQCVLNLRLHGYGACNSVLDMEHADWKVFLIFSSAMSHAG